MATVAEQLGSAALRDALNRTEAELSNGGKWAEWWWNTGQCTTTGWTQRATNKYAAAIWTGGAFAAPCYAIVTLAKPLTETRGLTIAICKVPAAETFLALSVFYVSASKVKLALEKAEAGVETELASVEVEYTEGDDFAVTVEAGAIKGWRRKGGVGTFVEVLSAPAPALAGFGGDMGLQLFGETTTNTNRITNLRSGTLLKPGATVKEQLEALGVLDTLKGAENPMAGEWEVAPAVTNTGQKTATGWALTAEKTSAGAKRKAAQSFALGGIIAYEIPVLAVNGQSLEMQFGVTGEPQKAGLAIVRTAVGTCTLSLFGSGVPAGSEKTGVGIAAGDAFGLTWEPSGKLTAWRRTGGVWSEVLSVTAAAPGEAALRPAIFNWSEGIAGTSGRIANFGFAVLSPVAVGPRPGSLGLLGVGR